ncbi:cache domain-containing sensor histidine kinase [Cohnella sp. JJ-181]|uniref:cache domain-containing sensor histidine kinase n=1 Tax=Cohnella rhizoplanae TaxID=2974897 RepID=UPI0022FF5DF5|nr:histidine kinase [Cohnella sp. JJ-181]CAI6042660.1 hypothetical protein COHCIP112018_01149 [Cohnella sp. JJ-181]
MIKWLRGLLFERVSTKLVAMVLSLILLSATLISTMYYGSSVSIIGNHVRASTKQGAQQTADYLSLMLTVGTDMGQQIFRNNRLQEALNREKEGSLSVDDRFEIKDSIGQTLNNTIYSSSFVRGIYILRENGESWGSGMFNPSKVKRYTLSGHDWYSTAVGGTANEFWLPLGYDPFSGGGDDTDLVLTLVDAFRDLKTKEIAGVILVNLDGQLLQDAAQRIQLGKTGAWRVVDADGRVMIGPEAAEWGRLLADGALARTIAAQRDEALEYQAKVGGESFYVVSVPMANGWKLVGQVPVREIVGDIVSLQRKITMYTALFLLLALLVGLLFSMRITRPLQELTRQMKSLEASNFKARSRIASRDEIGRLSLRFNQMAQQIESLIAEVDEAGAKKREAEIRALRHQINPHFLYNTLSSIRWMIKLGNGEGAYAGIAALVELMESSMGKSSVFTTIGEELALLRKYMVIQRLRYGEGIALEVDADEEALDFRIPRLLLQPIVENAIFHGLAPRDGRGTVRLTVRRRDLPPSVAIAIADDGAGMPAELLESLPRADRDPGRPGMLGIGLQHVRETIGLYYGGISGLSIRSEAGRGTVVELILAPREEMKDDAL